MVSHNNTLKSKYKIINRKIFHSLRKSQSQEIHKSRVHLPGICKHCIKSLHKV